jgi:2-oxoglutarate ferredoxin oxidoreductase subunit gamma
MNERKEIRIAGLGGQGVVLAGALLGEAAVKQNLYAAGSNSYGAQARGGGARSDLVLDVKEIDYPHVERPDLLVAMSQGAYDAYLPGVAQGGMVLFDSGLVSPSPPHDRFGAEVTALALTELSNRQVANVIWVGLIVGATGWFDPVIVEQAMAEFVPERFLELNRKALALGLERGRAWGEA